MKKRKQTNETNSDSVWRIGGSEDFCGEVSISFKGVLTIGEELKQNIAAVPT